MINALRGMKDTISPTSEIYAHIIETCTKIAQNYGFSFIETPILEETALFKRSVGESSDIVNKEMYQFIDKGENDVCLRPEGTAGASDTAGRGRSPRRVRRRARAGRAAS